MEIIASHHNQIKGYLVNRLNPIEVVEIITSHNPIRECLVIPVNPIEAVEMMLNRNVSKHHNNRAGAREDLANRHNLQVTRHNPTKIRVVVKEEMIMALSNM